MKLIQVPVRWSHQLTRGMVVKIKRKKFQISSPIKDAYILPTGEVVSNKLRNKAWCVSLDKPKSKPMLFCFDLIFGNHIKVYIPKI